MSSDGGGGTKRKFESDDAPEALSKASRTAESCASNDFGGNYIEVDGKSCLHRVAWPEDQSPPSSDNNSPPLFKGPYAKDYPFELDPFQSTSIACLEAGDSILVSAHTSAGKTAVAQYACAMALRDRTRMIYTSPLKALSNQKYRELYDDFQDVGLLTGDVTIHEDASCLVVTTEVFRSMLYENNSVIHEIKSVVFDEVHYLRDKERGVVWEESLILLPPQTQAIFLSATVSNAMEFATWFASVHGSKCHIVYTENRPVPLQHYIFPAGADGMYMTIDEKSRFLEENFQQACSEITGQSITAQLKQSKESSSRYSLDTSSDIFKLMKMVLQRGYDPVIVFAFSKRTCEMLALQLSVMDINDDNEKKMVEQILRNAIDSLSEKDRRLPQVQHILPMLKRGIGVHHSGLLPIVKEVVELLFQEGFIKILFATETFSTGLNMPAKTVVFAGAKKFDDGGFRWLYPGEYIQMSGRAGRRGIDDKGIVIMIADKSMDVTTMRDILKGSPLPLLSAFRISYRMILDNLKMEGGDPEVIIRKSFRQFLCQAAAPKVEQQLQELEMTLHEMEMSEMDRMVEQYVQDRLECVRLRAIVRERVTQAKHCLPFLNPGRLVSIAAPASELKEASNAESFQSQLAPCWGVVVNFVKRDKSATEERGVEFMVDVLINAKKGVESYDWLGADSDKGTPHVIGFPLDSLERISTIRMHLPKNLKSLSGRSMAFKCLKEVIQRLTLEQGAVPLLDPIKDMKITGGKLKKTVKALKSLESALDKNATPQMPDFELHLQRHFHRKSLLSEKKSLESELEAARDMILKQELRRMLRLLVRLEYIDDTGLVLKKGQIASRFRTADELILTEMVFNGHLATLTPQQIAALVACIIHPEGTPPETKASSELMEVFQLLEKTAGEIGRVAVDCKVLKHFQDYTQQFKPHFMEAVSAWSNGATFGEVIKLSDIYEGSAVRMIRHVHRVLEELDAAVKLTGQVELQERIQAAQESIKRDVIFAGSLYL